MDNVVELENVGKRFPRTQAVRDVSFQISRGELIGLLGPNGAGKTTIMRMIAGYLPPSSGRVQVADCLPGEDSLTVRRRIGYLPERNPLYPEMRVNEYLRYRGSLKGLSGKHRRNRLNEVKELCGLGEVGRKVIGRLSKGFCQRVGLADALLHEPELLILDEPTMGLDPFQIHQMRDLIRSLTGRHTVLLSSHVLSEVEMVCNRVIILNAGRVVAADSLDTLRNRAQRKVQVEAEIFADEDELIKGLETLSDAHEIELKPCEEGWYQCRMQGGGTADLRLALYDLCARNGWMMRSLRRQDQSLEELFLQLTHSSEEQGKT